MAEEKKYCVREVRKFGEAYGWVLANKWLFEVAKDPVVRLGAAKILVRDALPYYKKAVPDEIAPIFRQVCDINELEKKCREFICSEDSSAIENFEGEQK